MNVQCYELHGTRVAQLASIGDALRTDKQAIEIISAASACQPELINIPVERLSEDFLNLKTRVAGEVLQKFVTYQKRVVILGDISTRLNESSSLRDLIYECNAGREIWFVATLQELDQRLRTQAKQS